MLFDIGCTIGLVVSQRYQADAQRQRGIQSDHGLRSACWLGHRGSRGVPAKGEGEGVCDAGRMGFGLHAG